MRSMGTVLGLVAAAVGIVDASVARADTWPITRHDAARTGASAGTVPVDQPFVTWRAYMGGRPVAQTVQFGIGDQSTMVAAVGGRFIVKNAMTQATLWKSDMLGVGAVEAIADLDGDDNLEVIVRAETRAHVLDGKTGALLWSSAPDAFRTPAAVRVVDLDGNGLPDVYVDECTTCAKQGTMSAGAYSFASGFAAPKTLWERALNASPSPVNSGSDAIVDLDEDGLAEVVLTSSDKVLVVRGSDGSPIATLALPSQDKNPFPHARVLAAEIDGLPGKELVIVQPSGQVATSAGPAGITVFRLNPKTGTNTLLYRRVADGYDESMVAQVDVVSDLDGNGIDEVIFSHRNASNGVFTTEILSGPSGTSVTTLTGARFEGAANLDGLPGAEVVLASQNGLSIHKLDAGQFVALAGPIPDVRVHRMPDKNAQRSGQLEFRLGVLERPGKRPALLVGKPSSQIPYADLADVGSFLDIRGLALSSAGVDDVGKHVPLVGEITGVIPAGGATRPYPQIAIGTTAGTVILLSQSFQGTNGIVFAGGKATGSIIGGAMQPNTGARGGPLIGRDEEGPFVVLPGSPIGLYVGDARFASLILPPLPRWIAARMGAPSILDLGAFGHVVVGVDGQSLVARRSSTGVVLNEVDLGLGAPHATPLPLSIASTSVPLVGIDWRVEGVQVVQKAVDFSKNALVWQGKPLPYGGFFASSVADLDEDGTDEWYSMNDGLNRRDAKTGDVKTVAGEGMGYSLPMAASFAPDGEKALLLQGGGLPPKLLDASLKKVWQSPSAEPVNGMGGARVLCGAATRFVTPSVLSPTLRAYDGATGALVAERALAGGVAYSSIALATLAGKQPGVLSNATSVAKLGQGNGAVLVGSSDGYLYAVDACTLDLRWSKFLGGSVSEPIVGDTDGDAGDEIVVSVADGYIVNIDVPRLSPTDGITFVGPKNGNAPIVISPGQDVTISFGQVSGATSYEYALVGPENEALWSPAHRDVATNQVTVNLDGVLASRPYRIAVRAKGPAGSSPEAFSETIVVEDRNAPTLTATATAHDDTVVVSMKAQDDLALDHFIVWMRDAENAESPLLVAGEALLDGPSAEIEPAFVVPVELWGKNVGIRVDVLDSAGNSAQSTFNAKINKSGHVVGVSVDESVFDDEPLSFGGCRASGNGPANAGAALVIGFALALARRARRRRC
ncbi:MAG: PQQ-binding-like beta-propeller repeat protein [Polyangiaceae bacterium]|nr:PQQ-binding-like beta-propeller repeat protein [Polyangiaceae bacterium]